MGESKCENGWERCERLGLESWVPPWLRDLRWVEISEPGVAYPIYVGPQDEAHSFLDDYEGRLGR